MFSRWILRLPALRFYVLLAITGIAFVAAFPHAGLLFHGTFGTEVLTGSSAESKLSDGGDTGDYVDVTGDATIDTGFNIRTDGFADGANAHVLAVAVHDKVVLVKVDEPNGATRFRGRTIGTDPHLLDTLVPSGTNRRIASGIFPVMIDATKDYRLRSTLTTVALAGLLVVTSLFGLRLLDLRRSPWKCKAIASLGGEPRPTLDAINNDLTHVSALLNKDAAIGPQVLVVRRKLRVVPLTEIVWVYSKVVLGDRSGLGLKQSRGTKTELTIIHTADGAKLEFRSRDGDPIHPHVIARMAPWVRVGYTDELVSRWRLPYERAQLIAEARTFQARLRSTTTPPVYTPPAPTTPPPWGGPPQW